MKYKKLGSSGLHVSELCLGAMTFGEELGIGAPEAACRGVFEAFVAAGGNFIDTANIYNRGTSERMVGRFVATDRDHFVLGSKYSLTTRPDDPNAGGNHRKNLVVSLNDTLRRLGTDYLDIYWVHGWDQRTAVGDLMRALDDQVRAGKILHIGVSNAPAWVIAAANTLAQERGLTPFTAMQLHYNLVERSIERDFFDLAVAHDMAITPWSPLAGGLLTGKFDRAGARPANARLSTSPIGARVLRESNLVAAEALSAMAGEIGCLPAQLALAWLRQRSGVCVVPIIGARDVAQLRQNLGCLDLRLSGPQIERLDALAAPALDYPRSLLGGEFFQRMMHGEALALMEPLERTGPGPVPR